jgi:hypothetical protein
MSTQKLRMFSRRYRLFALYCMPFGTTLREWDGRNNFFTANVKPSKIVRKRREVVSMPEKNSFSLSPEPKTSLHPSCRFVSVYKERDQ